ncbi:phage tail protein [Streptomyces sp. NPDC058045]|uniref:phage tail protein n=1 Tax=Streptomyces sp. NPDC058045 TaxID=3346311 RepID=UPI0036E9A544
MPAADFTEIAELRQGLIRKALRYAIFAADTTADLVTEPFDTAGILQTLPDGYLPVGFTTTDGVTFSGDLSTSDVESGQSASPTRSDVETDTATAQWVPQETNAAAVALYENLPLSGAGALPVLGTATWTWSRPKTPPTRYRRLVFIAEDLNKETGNPFYIVRHFPSALRSGREDEQWTRTAEISRGVTYQAYLDDAAGTDSTTWIDGKGWRDFAAPAAPPETP